MLNISNMERVSKILEMKPEDITRYDIKAGTKKYKSNTDEGWELVLALRELDNGKAEKLNQKAEECERKMREEREAKNNEKLSLKEIFKVAGSNLLVKFRIIKSDKEMKNMTDEELEKELEKVNEIIENEIDEENLTIKEINAKKVAKADAKILKDKLETEDSIRTLKSFNKRVRKNNISNWLKIKLAELVLLILTPINLILLGIMVVFNLLVGSLLLTEVKLFE